MSQALALVAQSQPLEQKIQYANMMAKANLLPKAFAQQPGNVLLAMELGEALGVRPIVAMLQVHVIEGRPAAGSALIQSLVRRAGHKVRIKTNQEAGTATCTIVRSDDPDWPTEVTWTRAMAQKAGLLGKDNWRKYEEDMLVARATAACARRACPEVLCGINNSPEELGDSQWSEHGGTGPVPVLSATEVAELPATETGRRYRHIQVSEPEPIAEPVKAEPQAKPAQDPEPTVEDQPDAQVSEEVTDVVEATWSAVERPDEPATQSERHEAWDAFRKIYLDEAEDKLRELFPKGFRSATRQMVADLYAHLDALPGQGVF